MELVHEQTKIFGDINNWEKIFTTSKINKGFHLQNPYVSQLSEAQTGRQASLQ